MDTAFFRSFFVDNDKLSNPLRITPTDFDDAPVVVVDLSHDQAGELLGVSKVKGGNRMATCCVLSEPRQGQDLVVCVASSLLDGLRLYFRTPEHVRHSGGLRAS
jgi:hypothetical protein